MTQTIDQRARELLAKQVEADWQSGAEAIRSNQITAAKFGSDTYPWIMCALAALTEALTRIDELEGALKPFAADYEMWRKAVDDRNIDDDHDIAIHTQLSVGDLRKDSATLTQGIKE